MATARTTGMAAAALAALMTIAAAAPAAAAPLLQTDDAGVLDTAECEVEAGVAQVRDAGVSVRDSALGLACGIGWRSQLGVGAGWSRAPGAATARGATLGGKTALWRPGGSDADGGPALTLGWELAAARDAGDWARAGQSVALLYSVSWAGGDLHANLGHSRDRRARGSATTWGLAFDAEAHALGALAWRPRAEVAGDDHGGLGWAVGLQLTLLSDRLTVDLMHGRPVGPSGLRQRGLGFKLAF